MYYLHNKNINKYVYKKYIKKVVGEVPKKKRTTSEQYNLPLITRLEKLNNFLRVDDLPLEEKAVFLFKAYRHEKNQYEILYPEKYNKT